MVVNTSKQWEPVYCVVIMKDEASFEGWLRPDLEVPGRILIQPSVVYNPNAYSFMIHSELIASIFPTLPPERES